MGFLKNAFGDNRVLSAKDPEIQKILTYMDRKYQASINEYTERNGNWYVLRCASKKYFEFLYFNGYLRDGMIEVPGKGSVFYSKVEAYDGLVWLYNLLEGQEKDKKLDEELF